MNGNGQCSACGKYALSLGHLEDGAEIFRCYECGHMWGERLVVYDVAFSLTEHRPEAGSEPAFAAGLSLSVASAP